jgi:hypothetical protein
MKQFRPLFIIMTLMPLILFVDISTTPKEYFMRLHDFALLMDFIFQCEVYILWFKSVL